MPTIRPANHLLLGRTLLANALEALEAQRLARSIRFIQIFDIVANKGISWMFVPTEQRLAGFFMNLGTKDREFTIHRPQPKIDIVDSILIANGVKVRARKIDVTIHLPNRIMHLHERQLERLARDIIHKVKYSILIQRLLKMNLHRSFDVFCIKHQGFVRFGRDRPAYQDKQQGESPRDVSTPPVQNWEPTIACLPSYDA